MRLAPTLLALAAGAVLSPVVLSPVFAADPAAPPIRIGLTCPFTGGSSPMGESMRNGVRMAAEEINWKGGVLGRPIDKERVPGVVSTYEQPFTKTDHEAVTANMVTMGEVRQGIITFAYKDDEKAAIIGRKRSK